MATYEKNQLYMVPLAELQADPSQPRKYMDPAALEELTASVRQHGIIQPVVCRQDPATNLVYTVAGERRSAAARLAGLTEVPAIFIDGGNCDEIALVENLLRQDLNPVEEAEALQRLMETHAYPQDRLATVMGKDQSTISRSLSLNRLPKEIRDQCRQDPTVPKKVLVEIAGKKQERSMLTAFRKYQDQQAREAARESGEAAAAPQRKRTRAEAIANQLGAMASKIGDLEFPDFSAEDRAMIIEAMNSVKETLDEAIPRAVKNTKKPT
ncbi:MAG: ParB/RepB/Spo0J family partition protein [Deltaproteobacteria bacterium]|nr:ParB/RepB/Spo0J family partition protein [Deltaproteobacteria bacterium]